MITLCSNVAGVGDLMLPTGISEIKEDYFKTLLKNVNPGEHYTVVALIYSENLFGLISGMAKGNATAAVTPMIAKSNKPEFVVGQIPIIDRSSIERGVHIHLADNVLAPSYVYNYVMKDDELKKAILNGTYFSEDGRPRIGKANSPVCHFIEFKVIANNDIVGTMFYSTVPNIEATSYYIKCSPVQN